MHLELVSTQNYTTSLMKSNKFWYSQNILADSALDVLVDSNPQATTGVEDIVIDRSNHDDFSCVKLESFQENFPWKLKLVLEQRHHIESVGLFIGELSAISGQREASHFKAAVAFCFFFL